MIYKEYKVTDEKFKDIKENYWAFQSIIAEDFIDNIIGKKPDGQVTKEDIELVLNSIPDNQSRYFCKEETTISNTLHWYRKIYKPGMTCEKIYLQEVILNYPILDVEEFSEKGFGVMFI